MNIIYNKINNIDFGEGEQNQKKADEDNEEEIINKREKDKYGNESIGEFKKGLREGKRILFYTEEDSLNRDRYEGEFKNGLREGKEILY